MSKGSILIVDDDAFFRNLYSEVLKDDGFDVVIASSGLEAIGIVESDLVDIVISDLVMPDISGQEVLERTKQHNALIDVIMITGHGTIDSAIKALKSGAFDYLRKPINHEELTLSVSRCIEQKQLVEENHNLKQSLKLYKVSKTIASCIDIEKLYNLTLDALLQEIPGDAGIFLLFDKDQSLLEMKAFRHIDKKRADITTGAFNTIHKDNSLSLQEVKVYANNELEVRDMESFNKFCSFLAVPVSREGKTSGLLVILSQHEKDSYSNRDIENSSFIAEQSALSFENAEKLSQAKELAFVDSLTDLYNPRFLNVALDREIKRSNRSRVPFSVLFMDLDHFKSVNDVHGHLVGSKVLVEVSGLLLQNVRDIDTVIRYGGDEYTMILVDTDDKTAFMVAERIRASIESNKFLSKEKLDLKLTASIGLAAYPMHAKTKEQLLEMADQAMYSGKEKSRNVVFAAPVPEKESTL